MWRRAFEVEQQDIRGAGEFFDEILEGLAQLGEIEQENLNHSREINSSHRRSGSQKVSMASRREEF
jgi:hypothetical protein